MRFVVRPSNAIYLVGKLSYVVKSVLFATNHILITALAVQFAELTVITTAAKAAQVMGRSKKCFAVTETDLEAFSQAVSMKLKVKIDYHYRFLDLIIRKLI